MVLSGTIFFTKKSKICKIGDLGVVELDFLFIFAKKNLLTWRRSSVLKIKYFSCIFQKCVIYKTLLLRQVNRFLRNFFAKIKRKSSSTSPTFYSRKKQNFEDLGVVKLDFLFISAKKFLKNLLIWRRSSILKITYFSLKFSYFYCLIFNIYY